MREEKLLIRILRDLANLIADEASRNSEFACRLEAVLQAVPGRQTKKKNAKVIPDEELPDLFAEARTKSREDYEHWLAEFEIPVLKALVRKHDLDSSKRTRKWRESEKFAKLIADQIRSRVQRGSAFCLPLQHKCNAASDTISHGLATH